MDRRQFLQKVGLAGVAGSAASLIGCGVAGDSLSQTRSLTDGETRTVLVYDLVMEGWSTLGSGYLGDNGILYATQIRDFASLTLDYVQDPHGHIFTLTEAELAMVLLGQEARVLTSYALDHRHEVRVKPTRRVRNSQPIEVVIDANGRPV